MIGSASARDEGPPSAWSQEGVDEAATARVVVDGHGVVTAWNEGARRLLGHRAPEMIGRSGAVLLADAAPAHVLDSLTGLPRWSGTATLLHRDGHRLTVGLLAHHRENDGADDWLLVSPVTRPAPTPEDDAFVRRSFAQAPSTMALYDTGLRLRWANADMERVVGLSEREMRGLRVTEIVLDPESERTEEGMRTALETGRLQELGAALHLAGHERESVWSLSLVPVRDADGRLEGVLLSAHDVTEQYLARQRLVLVDDASLRIGSTLDLPRTAQELADVAVPRFADFVTVDLLPGIEEVRTRRRALRTVR